MGEAGTADSHIVDNGEICQTCFIVVRSVVQAHSTYGKTIGFFFAHHGVQVAEDDFCVGMRNAVIKLL
jgi:hypothetical protein